MGLLARTIWAAHCQQRQTGALTRWTERHFDAGETIVFKLMQPSRTEAAATTRFYDRVEPVFNRLLVFDDRIAHGVRPISGSMNPHDARFVVHGHLCETPRIAFTQGGLKDNPIA